MVAGEVSDSGVTCFSGSSVGQRLKQRVSLSQGNAGSLLGDQARARSGHTSVLGGLVFWDPSLLLRGSLVSRDK